MLKRFVYKKAAIFGHVTFEPYMSVCYGAYSRSFVTKFGDQSMSFATGVVLKRFVYKKAAIFAHVTFDSYVGVDYMDLGREARCSCDQV